MNLKIVFRTRWFLFIFEFHSIYYSPINLMIKHDYAVIIYASHPFNIVKRPGTITPWVSNSGPMTGGIHSDRKRQNSLKWLFFYNRINIKPTVIFFNFAINNFICRSQFIVREICFIYKTFVSVRHGNQLNTGISFVRCCASIFAPIILRWNSKKIFPWNITKKS